MINTKAMQTYAIEATDGPAGRVQDAYFDDEAWVVRYLLVEIGKLSSVRQVLIPSIALGMPDNASKTFLVSITHQQVANSPGVDIDKPVSRQYQAGRLAHYDYHKYWSEPLLGDPASFSSVMGTKLGNIPATIAESDDTNTRCARADAEACVDEQRHDDPHLRSANSLGQFHIHALEGDVGSVQGLLVDEKTWVIRYLIVSLGSRWTGHQTLLAPEWIEDIDWTEAKVVVNVSRDAIKSAPAYDPATTTSREIEVNIHKHYDRDDYRPRGIKREGVESDHQSGKPL